MAAAWRRQATMPASTVHTQVPKLFSSACLACLLETVVYASEVVICHGR